MKAFTLRLSEELLDALLARALRDARRRLRFVRSVDLPGVAPRSARLDLAVSRARLRLRHADGGRMRVEVRAGGEAVWSLPIGSYTQRLDLRFALLPLPELKLGGGGRLGLEADFTSVPITDVSARVQDSGPWPALVGSEWIEVLRRPIVEEVCAEALRFALGRVGRRRLDLGRGLSAALRDIGLAPDAALEVDEGFVELGSALETEAPWERADVAPSAGRASLHLQLGPAAMPAVAALLARALTRRTPGLRVGDPRLELGEDEARLHLDVELRAHPRLPTTRLPIRLRIAPRVEGDHIALHPRVERIELPLGLGRLLEALSATLERALVPRARVPRRYPLGDAPDEPELWIDGIQLSKRGARVDASLHDAG